jgi:hypothetical protein
MRALLVMAMLAAAGCSTVGLDDRIRPHYIESRNIEYKDRTGADIWQTPEETLLKKSGNCIDKTALLWFRLRENEIDSRIAYGYVDYSGVKKYHSWVVRGDMILDPTFDRITKTTNWAYVEETHLVNEFRKSYLIAQINGD